MTGLAVVVMAARPAVAASGDARTSLLDLSIEALGAIEVTTVSRRVENLREAPAATYVITRQQIRRSGVTSIPEALRLAPGVEVARNGAHSWTISLRGFNNDLSNKLLVLIDGRTVYSPLFAGVFWDVQDTLLEDIERIEVIAGPGGTLWGSNAVNGVISIITRSARDTQGGFVEVGAGDEDELIAGLRYGGRIGEDGAIRGYLKRFERDDSVRRDGADARDAWEMNQAGFRADWSPGRRTSLTLQGDVYDGEESALVRSDFTLGTLPEENLPGTIDVSGHNLLGKWAREQDDGAVLRLHAFYDHTERDIPGTFSEQRDTVDVDFVHDIGVIGRHELIWGAGYRITWDDIRNTRFATFRPDDRTDRTYSLFLQDKVDLYDGRVFLTVGTKLEHNDYSGLEHQPNVRLTWLAAEQQTIWASVSRAVRIPARLNEDLELFAPIAVPGVPVPLYVNVQSSDDFDPEELIAWEAGYRIAFAEDLSADLALFYHDYDRLMTQEQIGGVVAVSGPPPYLLLPIVQSNRMQGESYGGTAVVKWQPVRWGRLEFQLSHTELELDLESGSTDDAALRVAGNTPETQAAIYTYLDLPRNVGLYAGVRYVDELASQDVPSYVAVDLSIDWRVTPRVTATLTARNLSDSRHPEFGDGNEIERSALFKLDWAF